MTSRRDFMQTVAALGVLPAVRWPLPWRDAGPDPLARDLCAVALDAARLAGASYAEARVGAERRQALTTCDEVVVGFTDQETAGCGVRVLVAGAWGFAVTRELTRAGVARAARAAAAEARDAAGCGRVALAPVDPVSDGRWHAPVAIDPFSVPVEEKIGLLLGANAAARRVRRGAHVESALFFGRDERTFASTDGVVTSQTSHRAYPRMLMTVLGPDGAVATRRSTDVPPAAGGYEHVLRADLERQAPRWVEQAGRKLSARAVEPGRYDLVLDPSHLWLVLHETLGHAADRAGSVLAPGVRVGPEWLEVEGDRTRPDSLAAIGWDDEGVAAQTFPIVRAGVFAGAATTRECATGSRGCAAAESWAHPPLLRMPNVSILPGERDLGAGDLIAATERGIYLAGEAWFAVDPARSRLRFAADLAYEIRRGRIVAPLRGVCYEARTLDFWRSLDLIGGLRSQRLYGAFQDGKGSPAQICAVSHRCPPVRARGVPVYRGFSAGSRS